jgi:hypothetical protein
MILLLFVVEVVVMAVAVAVIAELPPRTDACTTSLEPERCTLQEIESFYVQALSQFLTLLVAIY